MLLYDTSFAFALLYFRSNVYIYVKCIPNLWNKQIVMFK